MRKPLPFYGKLLSEKPTPEGGTVTVRRMPIIAGMPTDKTKPAGMREVGYYDVTIVYSWDVEIISQKRSKNVFYE